MKSFQKNRDFRNIIHSKPALVFFGILVLVFAWGVIGFMGKMQLTQENKKIAEEKLAELQKEKEQFSSGIAKLNTPEGKEESIRTKFGLAKDGEGVISIVEDKNKQNATNTESGGFFSHLFFWKNWFK